MDTRFGRLCFITITLLTFHCVPRLGWRDCKMKESKAITFSSLFRPPGLFLLFRLPTSFSIQMFHLLWLKACSFFIDMSLLFFPRFSRLSFHPLPSLSWWWPKGLLETQSMSLTLSPDASLTACLFCCKGNQLMVMEEKSNKMTNVEGEWRRRRSKEVSEREYNAGKKQLCPLTLLLCSFVSRPIIVILSEV